MASYAITLFLDWVLSSPARIAVPPGVSEPEHFTDLLKVIPAIIGHNGRLLELIKECDEERDEQCDEECDESYRVTELSHELLLFGEWIRCNLARLAQLETGCEELAAIQKCCTKIDQIFQDTGASIEGTAPCLYALWYNRENWEKKLAEPTEQRFREIITNMSDRRKANARAALKSLEAFRSRHQIHNADQSFSNTDEPVPSVPPTTTLDNIFTVCRQHASCHCEDGIVAQRQHSFRLLLCSIDGERPADLTVYNLLLFSLAASPYIGGGDDSVRDVRPSRSGFWREFFINIRDVRPKKKVRYARAPEADAQNSNDEHDMHLSNGFCDIFSKSPAELRARLELKVRDSKLWRTSCLHEPERTLDVEHVPMFSLADCFGPRTKDKFGIRMKYDTCMKLSLACIVAESAYVFYESLWFSEPWSSQNVQFARRRKLDGQQGAEVWIVEPYLSVTFAHDPSYGQENVQDDVWHRYPRIRALGIMLLEIGLGARLPVSYQERALDRRSNLQEEWGYAYNLANEFFVEKSPKKFDYPGYWKAVHLCLAPNEWNRTTSMEERRKVLFEKVVTPLKSMTRVMGHRDFNKVHKLDMTGNLEQSLTKCTVEVANVDTTRISPPGESFTTKAAPWLRNLSSIDEQLCGATPGPCDPRRIRIAILDTGFDDQSSRFQVPQVRDRICKCWPSFEEAGKDSDGHGTHLIGLITRLAPHVDIYIARVAKSSDEFDQAFDNIARAITWATEECDVDIVSMSFGSSKEISVISEAITKAGTRKLFFAAAGNRGPSRPEDFPANLPGVISIRAVDVPGGVKVGTNPSREAGGRKPFGTLGHEVPSTPLDGSAGKGFAIMSGSSVATVIAVSMAATLLRYVSLKGDKYKHVEVKEVLATKRGMTAMFRHLGYDDDDSIHHLSLDKLKDREDRMRWSMFLSTLL